MLIPWTALSAKHFTLRNVLGYEQPSATNYGCAGLAGHYGEDVSTSVIFQRAKLRQSSAVQEPSLRLTSGPPKSDAKCRSAAFRMNHF